MNRAEEPERGPPSFQPATACAACDRRGARHQASAGPWLTPTSLSETPVRLVVLPISADPWAHLRTTVERTRAARTLALAATGKTLSSTSALPVTAPETQLALQSNARGELTTWVQPHASEGFRSPG